VYKFPNICRWVLNEAQIIASYMEQPRVSFFPHTQSKHRSSDYRDQGLLFIPMEQCIVLDIYYCLSFLFIFSVSSKKSRRKRFRPHKLYIVDLAMSVFPYERWDFGNYKSYNVGTWHVCSLAFYAAQVYLSRVPRPL